MSYFNLNCFFILLTLTLSLLSLLMGEVFKDIFFLLGTKCTINGQLSKTVKLTNQFLFKLSSLSLKIDKSVHEWALNRTWDLKLLSNRTLLIRKTNLTFIVYSYFTYCKLEEERTLAILCNNCSLFLELGDANLLLGIIYSASYTWQLSYIY